MQDVPPPELPDPRYIGKPSSSPVVTSTRRAGDATVGLDSSKLHGPPDAADLADRRSPQNEPASLRTNAAGSTVCPG